MESQLILLPMFAHMLWIAFLYALLTIVRAPAVWGIGSRSNGPSSFVKAEPKISANLSNQFEWPILFYVVCTLQISFGSIVDSDQIWLAWLFVAGRIIHSGVQILTCNVRLRGLVFTINYLAVITMWGLLCIDQLIT